MVAIGQSWDGAQNLTVYWSPTAGDSIIFTFEMDISPPYSVGDDFEVRYDPAHPDRGAVPADPTLTNDADYRANAVAQSLLPFTLAALLLVLFVIWPTKPSRLRLDRESAHSVQRALRRYLSMPVLICTIFVAASVAVQDLSAYSYNIDDTADGLARVSIIPLCWILARSFRHRRLMRLITATDEAVDGDGPITRMAGRKIWIDTSAVPGPVQDGVAPGIKMKALAGQDA